MANARTSIPEVDIIVTYYDDQGAKGETESIRVAPLAIMQCEDHFKRSFGDIFGEGKMGDILYMGWRQLRNSRPGNTQVKFDAWVAQIEHVDLEVITEADEDGNPT